MNVSDVLLFAKWFFSQIWVVWVAYCILPGCSFMICIRNVPSISSLRPCSTISVPLLGFRTYSFVWWYSLEHCAFSGRPKSFWLLSVLWPFGNGYVFYEWLLSFSCCILSLETHISLTQREIPKHLGCPLDNLLHFVHHPCTIFCGWMFWTSVMRNIILGAPCRHLRVSYSSCCGGHLLFWFAQGSFPFFLLEITTFSSFGNCPRPQPHHHLMSLLEPTIGNISPSGRREGQVPQAVLCHLLRYTHEKAHVPMWVSLPLCVHMRSLVGWDRTGLWVTIHSFPPAKRTLSLKAGRVER